MIPPTGKLIVEVTEVTDVTTSADALSRSNPHRNDVVTNVPKARPVDVRRPSYAVYDEDTITKDGIFRAGVWHHPSREQGSAHGSHDTWICSPLHVDAVTSNNGANFGRLLRFRNALGQWREWAMPMHLLKGSGEELRGELLDMGVEIGTTKRNLLNDYIQSCHPLRNATSANCTGWHSDELFILPRQNIGQGDAIYQSEAANGDDYSEGGSFDGWLKGIGSICPGNPLLQLAIGSSLAGVILYFVKRQGGGFHLVGDSSTGKTTLIMAAASVWGHGSAYTRTWRSTSNGLEAIAAQRNDTLLALDEIGEADPREIGSVVYALANGTGKSRANRRGYAQTTRRWRVTVLSAGEAGLSQIMSEAGKRARTGQEIRLLDIPANRAHGCWDHLHIYPSGRHLSDVVQEASTRHYGHLGPKFIEALIKSGRGHLLSERLAAITTKFKTETGQEARTADRFALIALALELATSFGLLPLTDDEGAESMVKLFNDWKNNRGSSNGEDQAILQSIAEFVSRHGDTCFSPRYGDAERSATVRDRAGWWDFVNQRRLWLFTSEGLKRAASGYDIRRVTAALDRSQWIADREPGKPSKVCSATIKMTGRIDSLIT